MYDLGTLGGDYSSANAINNIGQVVGVSSVNGLWPNHAFLYSNNIMQDLGTLGGNYSQAYCINSFGLVVGESDTSADRGKHAFLYRNGSMFDLQDLIAPDTGWQLIEAHGINDNGWIVGYGMKSGFSGSRAFLLTPIPEPSTIALFGAGILSLLAYARRQRRVA